MEKVHLRESAGESAAVFRACFRLAENRILEYVPLSGAAPASLGTTWEEAQEILASLPDSAGDGDALRELCRGESLISRCRLGEDRSSFEFRRSKGASVPSWFSLNLHVYPREGDFECFLHLRDVTDKVLEGQILSRLPMLGFDVVGLLYLKTGICRYFRIRKMRPGALYEHLEDYNASVGGDIETIVLPEQRARAREGLRVETICRRLEENALYPFPYAMRSRDGKVLQKLLQFSYLDEEKDTIFFCKSDVTEQHESERRQIALLDEARQEAERASEAKSAFLSSMSHDLRTPLNGVLGFTDLALREKDPEKKQEYLKKISFSGNLLLDLVNDTLELSRIESGKMTLEPEAVDARDLWEAVVTALRPSAELKGVRLETRFPDCAGKTVRADRLKVRKIVLNLLSNAIKFTPRGGTVSLAVEPLTPPVQGRNCRVTVTDDGIGMSGEFQKILFEPFTQEHRPEAAGTAGTGLGLAIVRRLTELMGGSVSVESEPGRGTRFTVDLPLPPAEKAAREPEAPDRLISLQGKRVLLCEDNSLNREIAVILLRELGVETDCAENGAAGVKAFSESAPGTYDAVLMDVRMPVMNGYEATGAIRALPRPDAGSIPILAMTADAFEEDVRRCREAGMDGHIAKPIDSGRLSELLCAHLVQERRNSTA